MFFFLQKGTQSNNQSHRMLYLNSYSAKFLKIHLEMEWVDL